MTVTAPAAGLAPQALRDAFSHFPQGVVLISAEVDGAPRGLVASTFTVGVSLDPPLVSVAVQHSSETWPQLRAAPVLGVSLLGSHQADVVRQLSSKDRDRRFEGIATEVRPDLSLTVGSSPVTMRTRVHDEVRAGDHDIVLLEILDIGTAPEAAPLVFHRSSFKEVTVPAGG
ncbi:MULTISPECIES: flavin reductase family protein [Brevibacterium]|uniref:Flavin reductase family protein n=1 Tax=Brevibacterium salitolerans TaxID=1403566 RepID=A0ABN2WEX0_9MICO|nr:flavin reductase family protein [Brevibacterium sp.]